MYYTVAHVSLTVFDHRFHVSPKAAAVTLRADRPVPHMHVEVAVLSVLLPPQTPKTSRASHSQH